MSSSCGFGLHTSKAALHGWLELGSLAGDRLPDPHLCYFAVCGAFQLGAAKGGRLGVL